MTKRRHSVLVTGGAGFIGSNLADRLMTTGHDVTILDDFSRLGTEKNLQWLQDNHGDGFAVDRGSITDPAVCERAVGGAEVVFHLAGQTAVTTSVSDPRRDFDSNAFGTFNILEAARAGGHNPTILYTSTNKVYGGMEDVPVVEQETRYAYRDLPRGADERQPLDFHSPYGCSKGAADQYVRDYARIYGLPTVVFRQSCIYGPRQMGVEDQGWVAWFIIALVTGKPIRIYGDGKQVRDLLYIDDLLTAYELAVEKIDTTRGQVYNIGGGFQNAMSIWCEFKPLLESALGYALPDPQFAATRPGDQPIFIADTTKAQRDFGWAPRIAIPDGVDRLAKWVVANRDLFDSPLVV